MGRKGVSKRKPQKTSKLSKTDSSNSSNIRSVEQPLVQPLSEEKGGSINRGGNNLSAAGSNKKHKKGI